MDRTIVSARNIKVPVGVDGCRAGWFYVYKKCSAFEFRIAKTLNELCAICPADSAIFIDCAIGLRDRSAVPRACDSDARKLLGRPRSSSVFPIPIRAVLRCKDYSSALAKSRRLSGKGLSKQAFAIMGKILELDDLLAGEKIQAPSFREIHPELCFWALARGRSMTHSKKSRRGFHERLTVLNEYCPQANDIIDLAMSRYSSRDLNRDDVVDALAALITGNSPAETLVTIPIEPEYDSRGLRMENAYRAWEA